MISVRHLFALLTLGFLSPVHAYWPMPWEGNFLVGVSGGYAERLDNVDITLVYTSPLVAIPSSFWVEDYTDTGYLGGFFLGYQAYLPYRAVLGLEFSVDWDYLDRKHFFGISDANATSGLSGLGYAGMATYKRATTFGLSARLGYEISRCFFPYVRAGVIKAKDTLTVAYAGDPAIYNFSIITQGDHPHIGYLLGIGFEVPVLIFPIPGLGVRAEYNYESRGRVTEALGTINDGIGFNPSFMNKMNPRTQVGKISVVLNI